jgi:hypothetical protein
MPGTEAQREGARQWWAQLTPEQRAAQVANAHRGLQVVYITRRIEQIKAKAEFITDEHRQEFAALAQGDGQE